MHCTATILYVIAGALLNRLRGWGIFPKDKVLTLHERVIKALKSKVVAVPFYFGIITALYTGSLTIGIIVALGYQFWAIWGWGDYWDGSDAENDEVAIIDDLFEEMPEGLIKDFLSLTLRGLIGYPTFIALYAFVPDLTWHALVIGLGTGLQGFIYHGFRLLTWNGKFVLASELTMGALWCYLVAQAVA